MVTSTERHVVFLPGGIMPAAAQYGPLIEALNGEAQPLLKDLEVYAGDSPPSGYDLRVEVEGLRRAAEAAGWPSFHLVGYSGGGAVALAFTATYPERVKSLALSEPAAIPSPEWLQQEADYWAHMEWVMTLPPDRQMPEFVRAHLRRGVPPPPPPPGEPPPWMAKRPAGLQAMEHAFASADIRLDQFRRFHKPVYLAIGSLSDPVEERKGEMLANLFPDFQVEVYEGRHHFDPPQRKEPERFAGALLRLWKRAERAEENQFSST